MKERNQRLRAIKKIIRSNRITSQDMLLQFLLQDDRLAYSPDFLHRSQDCALRRENDFEIAIESKS